MAGYLIMASPELSMVTGARAFLDFGLFYLFFGHFRTAQTLTPCGCLSSKKYPGL